MLREIFRFELRYHFKQPLIYVCLLLFFLLTFGAITSDAVTIGGAVGNVNRNAPFVIMQFLLVFSLFGIFTTTAFVANAAYRDSELKTEPLFFTSPIRKFDYLTGRFSGSFTMSLIVYLGAISAIMIGSFMPWLDKERIGPFLLKPYVYSLFVLVLPNLLLVAAIFFCVAALTRSVMATYSGMIAFFVGYLVANSFTGDLENEKLASLLDPFGLNTFFLATRYWTVYQKNHDLLPLTGIFLANRLIWMTVGLLIVAFTLYKFRFEAGGVRSGKRRKEADKGAELGADSISLPTVQQTFGSATSFAQFRSAFRLEVAQVFKSVPLVVILLLAVANVSADASSVNPIYGTSSYPVTHLMLGAIEGAFSIFVLILASFYAGEIVWRERQLKLNEVIDATPIPTSTMWMAKLGALIAVVFALLATGMLTTIVVQTFRGYHHYELGLYLRGIFVVMGSQMILLTLLAFFVQIVTTNKFAGLLSMIVYLVVMRVMVAMHLEHRLYRLDSVPQAVYSDMNGYGHYAAPTLWFTLYWMLFSGILVVIGHLLWTRGTQSSWATRMSIARARFGRTAAAAIALLTIGFISTGCYIYYNTNVLNHYHASDENERRAAEFEKRYKKYERLPQPRITDVQADVDIRPEDRSAEIRGKYVIGNKTAAPISELHILMNPDAASFEPVIPNARVENADKENGYTIYRIDPPLLPGASFTMRFRTRFVDAGFVNGHPDDTLVANGTFFNNEQVFPHIGYQPSVELQDRGKRRKYGLGPVSRMPKIDDPWGRDHTYIGRDSDWISLDTTVSTSPDQIAIAPGYLQKDWTANGRHYYHYKTTSPILGFWAYLSARYTVKHDQWNGIPIDVYYDAKHEYNVVRMIDAVKKSLDYYTKNFSPYQHKQLRILEFPLYNQFAQSFPNTIPYSESIGFIADNRDPEAIDYPFYVTAHEVGHQWWAHQVIGGDVQGSTMLSETMAQYSALMVMEKEYGKPTMKRFLKYELNSYLRARGGELVAEMPLDLVENQGYIHYNKGSLVMYRLRDAIGEDKVNAALAAFIRKTAFQQPPYTTSFELMDEFRKVTPPDQQALLHELFETITLFDNKATEAEATKLPDGRYKVTMTLSATKLVSNAGGAETPAPIDEWIDVGVLGDGGHSKTHDDKVLALERRHITAPVTRVEMIVKEKPTRAGIDPLNKLIDRNPDDNTKKL